MTRAAVLGVLALACSDDDNAMESESEGEPTGVPCPYATEVASCVQSAGFQCLEWRVSSGPSDPVFADARQECQDLGWSFRLDACPKACSGCGIDEGATCRVTWYYEPVNDACHRIAKGVTRSSCKQQLGGYYFSP